MNKQKKYAIFLAVTLVLGAAIIWAPGVYANSCNGGNNRAEAGDDIEIEAGESVRLGFGNDDGSCCNGNVSWSCSGGELSNRNSLRPTFHAPENDYYFSAGQDRVYTCTMNMQGDCGSGSDTVRIRVFGGDSNFKVALIAQPKTDCAPAYNVDLTATLSNYGSRNYDFTYYFDCDNDGDWEKTVTTDETSYTAAGLCDYNNIGSYTAKVKVTGRGRTATDTDIVKATDCRDNNEDGGSVSITKTVRNYSGGNYYQGTVAANPSDTVSYRIIIQAVGGGASDIIVSDSLPAGITNMRNLQIDGVSRGGYLPSGINIGDLNEGQARTITYDATIASAPYFNYGQATMTNVATVVVSGNSANSSAAVQVYRSAVKGATAVSTGFGGNPYAGAIAGLAGIMIFLVWFFRKTIFRTFGSGSQKQLQRKIAFVKSNGLAA